MFLDEYVGPSQSEWNVERLAAAEAVYLSLPARVRRRRRLQIPVDGKDPSEGVRASEILPLLARRFTITLRRDYGGTFLAVIHPHLDFSESTDAEREEILERIIEAERAAIRGGAPSYYTVAIARKAEA